MADITVTLNVDEIKIAILVYLAARGFSADMDNILLIDNQSGAEVVNLIAETTYVRLQTVD